MHTLSFRPILFLSVVALLGLASCAKIDVYEKNTVIPEHQWQYSLKPSFGFSITDTATLYNLYVVLRHTDAYRYNNIWLNIGSQAPADSIRYQRFELQLGSDASGWEGTGMDDIWEVRKSVTRGPFKFNRTGDYTFSVAQVMRENPLPAVISVGIRVEKVK